MINVRWANEDPNPGVMESLKRKAEETVIETIRSQLPVIGPEGTILDYENLSVRPSKKMLNSKEKKVESAFGSDMDAWTTYCHEYKAQHGVWPDAANIVPVSDENEEPTASSVYAIPRAKPEPAGKKALVADYASSDEDQ